ncbi:MAG: InlB B-repeat-containing protein [Paludibacteraceae bacterium]|nr:InlB B-repeat-containing protein [Paludibacteraceae bacterium]
MIMKTLHTIYTSFAKRFIMLLMVLMTIGIGSAWGEDYELVSTITDGEYVIGAVKGSAGTNTTIYAINNTDGSNWKSATETTPSNGKISNPASSIVWTLTKTGNNSFTLKNGSVYLTIATTTGSGSVRSNSTSAGTIYFASTGSSSTFEISGVSTFTVSSGNQVGYNIGNGYRQYAERGHSTTTTTGSISTQFRFYKKIASTFTVKCQSNNANYGTVSEASVTNVANNTSISAEGNVLTIGETEITATPNAQDANYTYAFSEWTGIPAGGKVTADVTVTANFTSTARALTNYRTTCSAQTSYSVTYKENGATSGNVPTDANSPYEENAEVTVLENTGNLAKTGHTFNGWNTRADGSGNNYTAGATFTITENTTLYAQWKQNYTITFHDGDDTTPWTQTIDAESIDLNTYVGTHACGEYNFAGWSTASTQYNDQTANITTWVTGTYTPTANIDLYAVYVKGDIAQDFALNCEGGVYEIWEKGTNKHMAGRQDGGNNKFYTTEYWDANNSESNGAPFTITKVADNTYTLQNADGQYIIGNTYDEDDLDIEDTWENADKYKWTISNGTNGTWRFTNKVSTNYALVFYSTSFQLRSASTVTSGSSYYDLELTPAASNVYQSNPNCGPYYIIFNTHGGEFIQGDEYPYGKEKTGLTETTDAKFPAAELEGYTFAGWKDGSPQEDINYEPYLKKAGDNLVVSSNKTYHAVYYYYDEEEDIDWSEEFTTGIYADVNGIKYFLAGTPDRGTMSSTTDCGYVSEVTITPGTGENAGKYKITVNDVGMAPEAGETDLVDGTAWWTITETSVGSGEYKISGEDKRNIVLRNSSFGHYSYNAGSSYGAGYYYPRFGKCLEHHWTSNPVDVYTMTWKIDEYIHATTTVQSGKTIAALPTNPLDNALGCCADKFIGWTASEAQTISKADVFTTLAEAKAKFPNITENKTFRAVFATAAQGVGTSIADFSEMGYENATAVTAPIFLGDGEGHGDATIRLAKAQSSSNAPTYYTDGEAVRIYAGGTITIESSYHIKNVTFAFATGDGTNEITANSGTYVENVWTENVESPTNNLILTIGGEAGQHRRIASITVTTGVSGSQYTNYVTQCTTLPNPALSDGSVSEIDVSCGDFSTLNNSQAITFSTMQNLTCPVTFEVIEGDFLISTARDRAAQYQSKVKVVPYKTGENLGKLRNVYVRANATDHNETFTGQIKVTSDEITENIIIDLTATVTCDKFTLTTNNHLGTETVVVGNYFAGDVIADEPTPSSDACTAGYTFDGWSTSEVEYGSVAYSKVTFPYTMPAEDVALYPVYRINPTEDYHRVTSDLGANNWAGDYLIAAASTIVADGRTSDLETINGANIDENIVPASFGDDYYVSLIAVEGGYVLKTRDDLKPYIYITDGATSGKTTDDLTTADDYPLTITWDEESKKITIHNAKNTKGYAINYSSRASPSRFGFFKASPIYLYKKSPLYTSSLICEEITAENAMVTSTAGQTVKVNVTATMSGMTVNRVRTLTVERDNKHFTATITPTATENEYNVAVSYTPSVEDITDGTETATITIKVNDNPVTTFQVTGRHLPENFVIAAKWGDNWYALPANCVNSGDSKQGILIDVDDINNPISATAPTTTKYGLHGVKPGRQTEYGQSILLTERVSNTQKALYQNNGANENIWVYAQYANYDKENPTYYEWIPSTNDLTNYTFTHSASSRKLGVNENGIFGAYTTDVQVRLLPATFYDQVAVQVIKWKANSVIVMYTGAETTATTQVGTNAATADQTLANQKITHGIYELTTNQSLTANAGKILTMCFGTTQVKVEVPLIVSEKVIASANGHDVVILNGGKLTAAATSYSYNTIYVYGGGKLAIPEGAQLDVNNIILRAGGIDGVGEDAIYQYIYPQVDLKGTLTAASQTFLKYEYVTDYDHWYHLVLPFNASLSTITYPQEYYGENVNADNKGSWVIKRYDGATRATGNYEAWKDIETDNPKATQVIAGKGYIYWGAPKKVTIGGDTQRQKWGIQRITMNKQADTAKNEENGNKKISGLSSYANVANNSGADNDQGWNLVGNPYMVNLTDMATAGLHACKLVEVIDPATGKWNGKWEWNNETDIRYLTIPSNHFDTYTAKTVAQTVPLVAGRAFFVQLEGEANGITFAAANRASLMPALLAENDDKPVDIETGIILSNETLQDEMNFWIKDGKTNDYEYNADYPKTPNNNRFNIYGVHTNGDLSWVAISPEFAAESMPIGYQVPAAGTYMLSLSETYYSEDLQALYVTDHAMSPELTVDLMSAPYEFSVNQAETNNERFTVSIILKTEEDDGGGDVSTGVDDATNNYRPIKFFYQDKLYILRNGIIYDAMGKQVKTINK